MLHASWRVAKPGWADESVILATDVVLLDQKSLHARSACETARQPSGLIAELTARILENNTHWMWRSMPWFASAPLPCQPVQIRRYSRW